MQGAHALRFHGFHDELVFAARNIGGEPRPAEDLHAVFQVEAGRAGAEGAKIHRADLTFVVLEREIDMSRLGAAQIGNLPFHKKDSESFLQEGFNVFVQL